MSSPLRSAVSAAVRDAGAVGNEIHVWGAHLERFAPHYREALGLLSFPEIRRAMRFRSALDGDRYVLAHALLRLLLAEYVGCLPTELEFGRGVHGKPCLLGDTGLHFNLSHSGDVMLAGIARVGEMGIDVEVERDIPDLDALAQSTMSMTEYADFTACPTHQRSRSFLQYWTRKEALAKATGTGLGSNTKPDAGWECHEIAWDGYVAAVAAPSANTCSRFRIVRVVESDHASRS